MIDHTVSSSIFHFKLIWTVRRTRKRPPIVGTFYPLVANLKILLHEQSRNNHPGRKCKNSQNFEQMWSNMACIFRKISCGDEVCPSLFCNFGFNRPDYVENTWPLGFSYFRILLPISDTGLLVTNIRLLFYYHCSIRSIGLVS